MNEVKEQFGPKTQTSQTSIHIAPHLLSVSRRRVYQPGFDCAVAVLFRVQFRCVLGRRFDHDFGMLKQVARPRLARVNSFMITDQDEAIGQKVPQVFEGRDHILAIPAAFAMPLVELARQRQPNSGR